MGYCKWNPGNHKDRGSKLQIAEFGKKALFTQEFHVADTELSCDMIIGRGTLIDLGILLDFEQKEIGWKGVRVPMKEPHTLDNPDAVQAFAMSSDPESCMEATDRATSILDITNKEADLSKLVKECNLLDSGQRKTLLELLQRYKGLFDGTIGDWNTDPVSIDIKQGAEPYHSQPYQVKKHSKAKFKREVDRLVEMEVLEKCSDSAWAAPAFTIPKKNPDEVRFLTNFGQFNKGIMRNLSRFHK